MPQTRYRNTWDRVASLDVDFIASWGALKGYVGAIEFDDDLTPRAIHCEHDPATDRFACFYVWSADRKRDANPAPIRSTVQIERRPQQFGGTRPHFICPDCGRSTRRLAILADGLRCGRCGGVTWASRREQPIQRKLRRARVLAERLGMETWSDAIRRPAHMRVQTFAPIAAELDALQREITAVARARLARGRGVVGQVRALAALERWGF
jgi:ribosomal protein S27AE